jgi:hypothetical protein
MKKISIFLLLVYSNNIYADCQNPVSLINQGDSAKCSGYLFSFSKESEVRKNIQDYHLLQQQDSLKDKEIYDLKQEVNNLTDALNSSKIESEVWRSKAVDSTEKLVSANNDRSTKDLLLIGLGILTAVTAGLAVKYSSK